VPVLVHTGFVQPAPDEIREQLDRILASEPFANSDRLRRFLRYVVDRTLTGEGDRLKEYVIGAEVFDRTDQYDPRLDSIVRVEAGRLRAKLDEYYIGAGRLDPVVIRLPRGGYAPAFAHAEPAAATPPAAEVKEVARGPRRWRGYGLATAVGLTLLLAGIAVGRSTISGPVNSTPRVAIAVLPFASYSTDEAIRLLAARVTSGVAGELARVGSLAVVSQTSALQFADRRGPLRDVAAALNAEVILEGSVLVDGERVRVDARLVDAATDRKFWVEEFVGDAADVRELERRVAAAAAAGIEQWKGAQGGR
jgi:TolB-like protein